MLTGIAHLQMHVRDLAACRRIYGGQLDLQELASAVDAHGRGVSMFATGASVLELIEDPDAVVSNQPSGERKEFEDVPGSVGHWGFYVLDNDEAFVALKGFLDSNARATTDGPEEQSIDHGYMQRTLLQFDDPDGYIIQISDVIDPREKRKARRARKRALAQAGGAAGLLRGFDHLSIECSDIDATGELFGRKLAMQEVDRRTTGNGPMVVFAVGITDLEISQSATATGQRLGPGAVISLGFWTDDVEQAYHALKQDGVDVGPPPAPISPVAGMSRRAFTFAGLDGLRLEIAQRA